MVQAKDPPSYYLAKLRTYLDPKASRSHRVSVNAIYLNVFIINKTFSLYLYLYIYIVVLNLFSVKKRILCFF